MTVKICSCEGLNPTCTKCFGSGYATIETNEKSLKSNKKPRLEQESYLTDSSTTLERKEIQNMVDKIITTLDLKSMQQMRILHSIPFTSTTFRRDFKDKFESFRIMEDEKRFLRNKLDTITKESIEVGISFHFKFNHLLSDKDIDVTSNRELKTLIREYKKLKK